MKKKIIKYLLLISTLFISIIFYLSVFGLETENFNNQIKNKIIKTNKNLKIELKTTKIILDPFNFRINAKTIGTKINHKGKKIELEYIKTQISLISLIKNKFVSSNIELSTKSILFKDLVAFISSTRNETEPFIQEQAIQKGQIIVNIKLNFDENGKIKKDYKISGLLKDGKIDLSKTHQFKKIDFIFNVEDNIFSFKDISFKTNKTDFFSDNLKVVKKNKNFIFKGKIQNKNSILSNELLNSIKLDLKNINLSNTVFSSKNFFSFEVDDKLEIKNLVIDSEILINQSEFSKLDIFNKYFPGINDLIYIKDHKIKSTYKQNNITLEGSGKIKLEKEYDQINYIFNNNEKDFSLVSNIELSELKLKNHNFLKSFIPKSNEIVDLKNQQIQIDYYKDNLSIKGSGKIKFEKKFDKINFHISKKNNNINFNTQINLDKTLLKINFLNFTKNKKFKTKLSIYGDYEINDELNFKEVSIFENDNKIILKNLSLDNKFKFIKADKVDLDYFDNENKKNQFLLLRKQKNNYVINGAIFNANSLITELLQSKTSEDSQIFKNDINLNLNINEVYIDDKNIINDLKGYIKIKDNNIYDSNIVAYFNDKKKLTFTAKTNNNEKVTTFYSSYAKSFVKRYDFIKGFEEGDLNFYSTKKNKISNSVLKIDNFKVQEVPVLAKLLSLASLQGIADLLTGEGIRFTDFEMEFSNKEELMTIDELYAIGPSVSILMEGYIQSNDLISLRGTLVPASTINRTIASIPLVGNLLIGKKVGEGVFGVSFKIKGPPKDLKTSVNPVKTLTPRFITRTLEKLKKN
jgi:hypothetical protein